MPFTCQCPYCSAVLEVPDEYDGRTVTCLSCKGIFYAEKNPPAIIIPTPATPPKSATEMKGCRGCLVVLAIFIAFIAIMAIFGERSTTPSDGGREFRIKREAEHLRYERARGVRDALEHIEAEKRSRY